MFWLLSDFTRELELMFSFKFSPLETLRMKLQALVSVKNIKNHTITPAFFLAHLSSAQDELL